MIRFLGHHTRWSMLKVCTEYYQIQCCMNFHSLEIFESSQFNVSNSLKPHSIILVLMITDNSFAMWAYHFYDM